MSLAVLDLTTGVTVIRGSIGVETNENITYMRSEHLCCVQRTLRDGLGVVTQEGVMLLSARTLDEVYISRDSGATWQEYITFPRPQSGAYYVGSPLSVGVRPGEILG